MPWVPTRELPAEAARLQARVPAGCPLVVSVVGDTLQVATGADVWCVGRVRHVSCWLDGYVTAWLTLQARDGASGGV